MDRQEIKFLLNYTENYQGHLNSLQLNFLVTLKNLFNATGVLTRKQVEFLYEIKESIPAHSSEESVLQPEYYNYPAQYATINYNAFV